MFRRLIFLVFWPITAFEERKWHFDYLRSQGFEVEVFDLTYLLNREAILNHPVTHVLQGDFIRHINTYRELEELLSIYVDDSLFIDYILGLSDINLKVEKVFRLLKKYQARYTFISAAAWPLPSSTSGEVKSLAAQMRKAINPLKLLNYIANRCILLLSRQGLAYPSPFIIFGGHSEALKRYISKRNICREKIIHIPSFDYDTYLYYRRSLGIKAIAPENTCVFLDAAITHHSDFTILGISPIGAKEYFASMNRFFGFIEKMTGLQVVIAAHPRSEYETTLGIFGGRPIIKGKTVELVAKSSLVVTHYSTSVSFAVLFKKPVVLVKTAGMKTISLINTSTDTMAAALGTLPIDVDKDQLSPSLLSLNVDHKKYEAYLYRYIKSPDIEELPTWNIVASEIKKLKCLI